MIIFKKDLSTQTPTWIARRTSADPFATYVGTIRLADGVAVLTFCGAATASELDHISEWMLELEAQHRANANSEQIEKDLQSALEVSTDEHADPHSRSDRFVSVNNGRPVDASPAMVGSDRIDRDIGGEA